MAVDFDFFKPFPSEFACIPAPVDLKSTSEELQFDSNDHSIQSRTKDLCRLLEVNESAPDWQQKLCDTLHQVWLWRAIDAQLRCPPSDREWNPPSELPEWIFHPYPAAYKNCVPYSDDGTVSLIDALELPKGTEDEGLIRLCVDLGFYWGSDDWYAELARILLETKFWHLFQKHGESVARDFFATCFQER
eukprot:TRINITY_DN12471_c0_g1_i1.p1 TRINITY_DN12471_c0_g1~~TRINITY_DN12471_c0_g1_i1.p1  ORF type:complete len:203 (+),score=26.52 TRINITY_DN12471_c0_g1_i1:42-611(+)